MVMRERAPSTMTPFEVDSIDLAQGFWEWLVFYLRLDDAPCGCHTRRHGRVGVLLVVDPFLSPLFAGCRYKHLSVSL